MQFLITRFILSIQQSFRSRFFGEFVLMVLTYYQVALINVYSFIQLVNSVRIKMLHEFQVNWFTGYIIYKMHT